MDGKILAQIARRHLELGQLYQELADRGDHPDPVDDRVVGLAEAAHRIGVTRSWLSRRENWRRVGGFLGEDRRVKFAESRLRAYLEGVATSGNR